MNNSGPLHEYSAEQVHSNLSDANLIWRLVAYLRPYRMMLIIAVLVLFVSKLIEAIVPLFIGHVSQKILDSFTLSFSEKNALMTQVFTECFFILGLFGLSFICDNANIGLRSWIGQKCLYRFRIQVYEHVLRMPLAYFDKSSVGRLMTRTIHDIDQINQMFSESVIPILGSIFLFISIFICILIMNWKIALFVLFLMPVVWWNTHRFRYLERRCYDRIRTVVSAMNTFVQEHLMGASTIRSFGLQAESRKYFEEINEDHCNAYIESIAHFSFFLASIDILQNVSLIAAFVLLVNFSADGFQAGMYFTFSLYVIMFFRPLSDLAERYNMLQSAMAAATRIFSVLDTPSETAIDQGKQELLQVDSIVFDNVWFAYEEGHWILKGLSFTLSKKESLAIVGMTGEGKSTILSLLLRFYEIPKGEIKINGRNIKEYSLNSLRRHFSIVLQDPVIFSGTIAENISIFNPSIHRHEIERVLNFLEIAPYIEKYAAGIDHGLKEQGKGLSVGERQLISLARAAAYQRSVLILDEATANIDGATEQLIQAALKRILGTTTAMVIAHRLSTIRDVTRIMVLQGGRIAEEGSHEELIALKGVYEKLYRLQFASS